MTGPVGLPVGEPPEGSTLTATLSAASSAARCAPLKMRSYVPPAGRRPSDTGWSPRGSARRRWIGLGGATAKCGDQRQA